MACHINGYNLKTALKSEIYTSRSTSAFPLNFTAVFFERGKLNFQFTYFACSFHNKKG